MNTGMWPMSEFLRSLQSKWKYHEPGRIIFLIARRVLRPLVFWDVHYVFNRDLSAHASTPPGDSNTDIRIFKSELDLAGAAADLTLLCPRVAERLREGQVLVVALTNTATSAKATDANITGVTAATGAKAAAAGAKPAAIKAKAAAQTRVAGYTWITFSNIWLPEFDLTMIVRPGEMVHYDSFVSNDCRGQGLHTTLILMAKQYALSTGCTHSLSWISMLNTQSLKTAHRLVRKPDRPMIVLSFKFRGMKRFRNVALRGSLATRFGIVRHG
jgi:hypothetical protein